jgi:transposase-like protein
MNKQRKQYEAAFKLDVARMVVDQGVSIAQVV